MSYLDEFTDTDLILIRNKLSWKYEKAWIWVMIYLIPLCLIMPLVPNRRFGPMIERMEYGDAVLKFSILWVCCLIGSYVYNEFQKVSTFNKMKQHFHKKEFIIDIISIRRPFFNRIAIIETKIDAKERKFEIDPDIMINVQKGDRVNLIVEIASQTVLQFKKCI